VPFYGLVAPQLYCLLSLCCFWFDFIAVNCMKWIYMNMYTILSKLISCAEYQYQQEFNMSTPLCTLNTIAAVFRIGLASIYCVLAYQNLQQCNRTRFRRSTSRKSILTYNFCCKGFQSKKLTRLRSKLLAGKFLCFRERWNVTFSLVSLHCTCAKNI